MGILGLGYPRINESVENPSRERTILCPSLQFFHRNHERKIDPIHENFPITFKILCHHEKIVAFPRNLSCDFPRIA